MRPEAGHRDGDAERGPADATAQKTFLHADESLAHGGTRRRHRSESGSGSEGGIQPGSGSESRVGSVSGIQTGVER